MNDEIIRIGLKLAFAIWFLTNIIGDCVTENGKDETTLNYIIRGISLITLTILIILV